MAKNELHELTSPDGYLTEGHRVGQGDGKRIAGARRIQETDVSGWLFNGRLEIKVG